MWWQDALWGYWNGLSAWVVLIAHAFDAWDQYPFYNAARSGNWYDLGFLIGAGSGIAWMAHVGGFLGGLGLVRLFARDSSTSILTDAAR